MKQMPQVFLTLAVSLAAGLLLAGCASPMLGSPSLSLLSRDVTSSSAGIRVIGNEIEYSDSWTWAAIFAMAGTPMLSHEAVVQRALDKYHADLLVDSELESSVFGCPYIFMQMKATVRGKPAVFVKGGER